MKQSIHIIFCLLFTLAVPVKSVASQTSLRAGVASMITPVSAVKYYQQVVDYIGEKLGMPAEMVHRTTYDEIDVMLGNNDVDVAFICSSPYVLDNEKFGVELLVAPQVNDKAYYNSNIIVHRDSTIETFDQLQGLSFVFVDPKSNTGRLYPTYVLAKRDETPESFFSSYQYSYSHNKSVEIVAKNRADGAAVDSIVYDFMVATGSPYTKQTKIIHRSPQFGIPPVVVPPGISPLLKESLRSIFLEMHDDPEGKKILEGMKIQRFVEVPDSNYDSIRAMRAFINNNSDALVAANIKPGNELNKEKETVLFGVLPRDNPIIAYERYQPLMDYLSAETGETVELHLEKNYTAVVDSLGQGKISFALLGPLTYLDAYKRFDAPPIAKSRTSRGETFFRSVIVTDKNGSIKEISQLVDKKFAFAALWSTSGNLVPRYMLAWAGIHLDNLSTYYHYNYHDTVAKKVISQEFDAGAIRLSTAERYTPYGLKIIATSEPIPTGPVVVSPLTPYPIVKKVQQALLSMTDSAEGQKILSKLDPDLQGGFVAASDADYTDIRQMINAVPKTCGKGCHPNVTF
jgi:phosphonate transport system substrate-binding protein